MSIQTRTVNLTSDAAGDVVATIKANGVIRQIVIVNDATDTPTTLWDVTVADGNATEIYQNLTVSIASNTAVVPSVAGTAGTDEFLFPATGILTITGANMGNAKKAVIIIYVEE